MARSATVRPLTVGLRDGAQTVEVGMTDTGHTGNTADTGTPGTPDGGSLSIANDASELSDGALQSEIELVADLVVAASQSETPLTLDQIDEVLGVAR
jgi:hypothetical protein